MQIQKCVSTKAKVPFSGNYFDFNNKRKQNNTNQKGWLPGLYNGLERIFLDGVYYHDEKIETANHHISLSISSSASSY